MKQKSAIPINQEEISVYLKDVRKLKVMTPERERVLADKMLSGKISLKEKEEIKKEILEGNLRFVITVSKQYQNQGLDLPDLIAEGNYGLMKAIENFDWSKKLRFISYAVWWIRQSILQSTGAAYRDNGADGEGTLSGRTDAADQRDGDRWGGVAASRWRASADAGNEGSLSGTRGVPFLARVIDGTMGSGGGRLWRDR